MARSEPYQILSIGHALRFIGVSQRLLAERVNISQSTISRMSNKPWGELDYEMVERIFRGIYYKGMEEKFEVHRASNGKVAGVYFV